MKIGTEANKQSIIHKKKEKHKHKFLEDDGGGRGMKGKKRKNKKKTLMTRGKSRYEALRSAHSLSSKLNAAQNSSAKDARSTCFLFRV